MTNQQHLQTKSKIRASQLTDPSKKRLSLERKYRNCVKYSGLH